MGRVGEAAGGGEGEDRLTYRLRVLCVDAAGRVTLLQRRGRVSVRSADHPIRLTGPEHRDIRRLNNGRLLPGAAHLVIELDGIPIVERIWPEQVDSAWWLKEWRLERR